MMGLSVVLMGVGETLMVVTSLWTSGTRQKGSGPGGLALLPPPLLPPLDDEEPAAPEEEEDVLAAPEELFSVPEQATAAPAAPALSAPKMA